MQWRTQLERLGDSFERVACQSRGIFHLMVEQQQSAHAAHDSDEARHLDSKHVIEEDFVQHVGSLPGDAPHFRGLTDEEAANAAAPADDDQFLRDKSGRAHAVLVPGITRMGRLEGDPLAMHQFLTLADAAGRVFRSIPSDSLMTLPSGVPELARRHRTVMRRLMFGVVPHRPSHWLGQGWQAGVMMFDHGIIIDATEAATGFEDGGGLWLLVLHRLGWHGSENSLVRARRWYWNENHHYSYEAVHRADADDSFLADELRKVPKHRFLSVIGGGTSSSERTNVCWASRWAIDELLRITEKASDISKLVREEIAAVDTAKTSSEKGKALERLMRVLFESVEGLRVRQCNVRTRTEEIDLVLNNTSRQHPWDREGALMLVECKNWTKRCGKNEVASFETKMKNRRNRCTVGFFVAWDGFAGTARKELLRSSREGWIMVLLEGARVREAAVAGSFTLLLEQAWYEALVQ